MEHDAASYISLSDKIKTNDLDWAAARRAGLTSDEVFILTFFSDVEQQTIRYLDEMFRFKFAFETDVGAFLVSWCYEELHHGRALLRLMNECGHRLDNHASRIAEHAKKSTFKERMHDVVGPPLSRIFEHQFPAVYASFGAIGEMTTLRGYERLEEMTTNPVLATLCARIAKQERRHMAWYINLAKQKLSESRVARTMTRALLRTLWSPVGAGIKSEADVERLFRLLFPGPLGVQLMREVDARTDELPGLENLRLLETYFGRYVS